MEASILPETSRNFRLPNFENRGYVIVNFAYGFSTERVALPKPKNGYATTIFKVQ